jgi:hypothetical protein
MARTNEYQYYFSGSYFLTSGHHSKTLTIGDCAKAEIKEYYEERLLPEIPPTLRRSLDFEKIFDFFGGKLAHWSDYLTDYVSSEGVLARTSSLLYPVLTNVSSSIDTV